MPYNPGTNSGHGHVWKRPDGVRMRCGGPGLCAECARDQTHKVSQLARELWTELGEPMGADGLRILEQALGQ